MNENSVFVTSRNSQVVFDNTLVVEHDTATAVSVEKPPHQLHLSSKRHNSQSSRKQCNDVKYVQNATLKFYRILSL